MLSAQITTLKVESGVSKSSVFVKNIPDFKGTEIYNMYLSAGVGKWVSDYVEVYIDGQYTTKGYSARFGNELTDVIVHNFNYLNLMPQVKYKPFGFFGISTGFNLGYKMTEKFREADLNLGPWRKNNALKKFDFSLVLGAHFHINHFYFKLLLDHGLPNLNTLNYTDEDGNQIQDSILKTRSIQVGFGYYILG